MYVLTKRVCLLLIFAALCSGSFARAAEKKILYIGSYHQGYDWSDGITAGVVSVLKHSDAELKIHRMDTKRHRSESFKKQAALKAKNIITAYQPDVVIASDDNTAKYLIKPYFRNCSLPFVFCGINWDASVYGLPCTNVTGMIEVAPVPQLIDYLQRYARGGRIGFLAPSLLSAQKEVDQYRQTFGIDVQPVFAKDLQSWKQAFLDFQDEVDMLIIDSNGGLYQEHQEDLIAFVEKHSRIPSGTILDFMAPYALITFAKVAEEQGAWAAEAAMRILRGVSPQDIPVSRNRDGSLIVNARIAQASSIEISYSVLKSATRIIE
ncbi:MAG: hypothetical protein K9K64_15050 [Desulfohalobiaceae bacterium]|nr:hypothetical protein [Desulfohalobiaceae bacterium]